MLLKLGLQLQRFFFLLSRLQQQFDQMFAPNNLSKHVFPYKFPDAVSNLLKLNTVLFQQA